jgi:integrase
MQSGRAAKVWDDALNLAILARWAQDKAVDFCGHYRAARPRARNPASSRCGCDQDEAGSRAGPYVPARWSRLPVWLAWISSTQAACEARYLKLPKGRRPFAVVWTKRRVQEWRRTGERPVIAVWTPAELAEFLSAIAGHPMFAAYHLIAMRGLRRGEACGLTWDDLDLDEGVAYISRQLQRGADGQLRVCPLKTESSLRAVALDPETVIVLHAQTHKFNDLVEEAGVPPVRLHDLRPGAATLMLLAGEGLKTIADPLGHSSVVLTADTYLSVAVELGLKAAAAAARLVLNAGKSPRAAAAPAGAAHPYWPRSPPDEQAPQDTPATAGGPTLPERPEDPDNANLARQPGLQRVNEEKRENNQPGAGPTWDPPTQEQALKGPAQTGCAARDLNPEPAD